MTIQYYKSGDYYLPNLILEETEAKTIGKYGRMRKRFLKEHRPALYSSMLLTGRLDQHLTEIDEACAERMEVLILQMAEQGGVTETLTEKKKEMFEDYMTTQREVNVLTDCETFIYAFRLAAKIMIDVLTDGQIRKI